MRNDRYTGIAWNDRFLPRLSTREVGEIDKQNSLLILPLGSVEQHGVHSPVFTDSYLNERLLQGALELLPADAGVWLLPPLYYGKSNEHEGFPGTYSLSTAAMHAVMMDLMRGIRAEGWSKLLLLNSHGGNIDIVSVVGRDARVELGLAVFCVHISGFYYSESLPARENEYGIHGGALETSLLLALKPEWVREDRYTAEYPAIAECSCFKLSGEVAFRWRTSDLSKSGVIGDPSLSSPELGRELYERAVRKIADTLLAALDMAI